MAFFPDLNEEQAVAEMIDHRLPPAAMPPFDGVIVFAAGGYDPVRAGFPKMFRDHGRPRFFFGAEVDVAFEGGGFDVQPEFVVQILDKPMNEMVGPIVAAMDEWIMTNHRPDL